MELFQMDQMHLTNILLILRARMYGSMFMANILLIA